MSGRYKKDNYYYYYYYYNANWTLINILFYEIRLYFWNVNIRIVTLLNPKRLCVITAWTFCDTFVIMLTRFFYNIDTFFYNVDVFYNVYERLKKLVKRCGDVCHTHSLYSFRLTRPFDLLSSGWRPKRNEWISYSSLKSMKLAYWCRKRGSSYRELRDGPETVVKDANPIRFAHQEDTQ